MALGFVFGGSGFRGLGLLAGQSADAKLESLLCNPKNRRKLLGMRMRPLGFRV